MSNAEKQLTNKNNSYRETYGKVLVPQSNKKLPWEKEKGSDLSKWWSLRLKGQVEKTSLSPKIHFSEELKI